MTSSSYRICTRCIMDTSDPQIVFDAAGVCNHCHEAATLLQRSLLPPAAARQELERIVARVKAAGQGHDYDCVIGLSGGVDSSYLAWLVKDLGLRPLAVHLDNGWNSELAVGNIERIVKRLDIDLYTHVIDWEEFRALQLAFFRASVVDIELLTDHAIAAVIYQVCRKHGIRYFFSGYNTATESVMPATWFHANKLDSRNIRDIYRRHGDGQPLKTFPMLSLPGFLLMSAGRVPVNIPLLNYVPYDKAAALKLLEEKLGWVNYGGKHFESRFTRFYQAYILPRKFGVDKRRAHLSSLVYSGQLTREEALQQLATEIDPQGTLEAERDYVIKKLMMTQEEFAAYMAAPAVPHLQYRSWEGLRRFLVGAKRLLRGGRRRS